MAELVPGEAVKKGQKTSEVQRIRNIIAESYTFVRSQEINRTIASFTLDHYIDEAKREIKGEGRQLRSASGEAYDVRATKLEELERMTTEFAETLPLLEELAKQTEDVKEEEEE